MPSFAATKTLASPPSATRRPKLAIAVGLGWGVRNYLLSQTFDELAKRFDLVVLAPYAELPEFRQQFTAPGVTVCGRRGELPRGMIARLLDRLTSVAFYRRRPTISRNRKQAELLSVRRHARHNPLHTMLSWAAALNYPLLRNLYRRHLTRHWPLVAEMRDILRREQVSAVFSTNLIEQWEWAVTLAADAEQLPIVTAVTSWDNPTTKPFPVVDARGYVVWTELMKREMQKYMDVGPASSIHVTGAPQFDFYRDPRYFQTREQFCAQLGLDPARKIIVYSTVPPNLMPDNAQMIALVHRLIRTAKLPGRPQLLVRLHPKDRLERYDGVRQDPALRDIAWTVAGEPRSDKRDQWCPDHDDMVRAVSTVRHGDVNVHAGYSTMMLDFAALDKPVVLLGFDSRGSTEQARVWESYEHLEPIVRSGAFDITYDWPQAELSIRQALEQPALRQQQRREVVALKLGRVDGRAGKRVAQAVSEVVLRDSPQRQAA